MEPYRVFVQWQRGKPHEYAQTVTAADDEMALMLAKRNIDLRSDPLDIWVTPESEITEMSKDETALTPSTDRTYREVSGYSAQPTDGST
ncbi:hypothetical protein [Natrarchaeobius chitinivorans]|nr:hypothetical protein [Natrarchaeobius chitinivorans]